MCTWTKLADLCQQGTVKANSLDFKSKLKHSSIKLPFPMSDKTGRIVMTEESSLMTNDPPYAGTTSR